MAREEYHALRRRQVAEAVERLVAAHGLDGVTVAKTAAEAGVSVGLVQHYFASKDDLLRYAYTQLTERTLARAIEQAEELDRHRSRIQQALAHALAERLPLDEPRRAEWRVAFAFATRAVDNPNLAAVRNHTEAQIRARLAQAISNGKKCGEVRNHTDPDTQASRLLAHLDGLALHTYLDPTALPASAALAALHDYLSGIFPGRCRAHD
ncbi:MAG TPA: TetR/AcrR family transcriptional regulator [Actinophytocola sp.]|uniref:TetR/AcrR family transcriptional regulator n=1 Tax=Actinophytocola sp. TaxID=1872138 RepID=UPI002DB8309E|nr:TetR/AcrR family transcriptional regulator [Actinophytocola sp.]HEU5469678.1 TetR/AcrR family transcriptional regulator [Actinophytocola sp.]